MTDYEVLTVFNEMSANTQDAYMNFVAILSGFLIAGFLVANKLSKSMTIIVTALFTVAALQQGSVIFLLWGDQVGLLADIHSREALNWHGASRGGPSLGPFFDWTFGITVIGGYIGALVFFFHQRRVGLKSN